MPGFEGTADPLRLGEYNGGAEQSASPTRQEILRQAAEYVTTDRNSSYGEPEDNFNTIADFWQTYLYRRVKALESRGESYAVNEIDTAIQMILLKVARIANDQNNLDNYIDLAGYAACAGEIAAKESEVNE